MEKKGRRKAAVMVDVGSKRETVREATARGFVKLRPKTVEMIRGGEIEKGDVVGTATVAGITAAKKTPEILPLCHPIPLTHVSIDVDVADEGVAITAKVRTKARTGVEMEALTAVSCSALCVYDMVKSVDRGAEITGIRLLEKSGGRSGHYVRAGRKR